MGDDAASMEYVRKVIDIFLHLDKYLGVIIEQYQGWTYGLLFLVIFCETGLVVTPFLPGDSLLFAAGAFAAKGAFNVHLLALLLFIAAVTGDALNYWIGRTVGLKAFKEGDPGFLRRYFLRMEYYRRTEAFFEKYGGKAIVLARFVPIIRTFAPFLGGVGKMSYPRFAFYNVTGAILWVGLFVYGGYFFSELPFVKKNFSIVILAIIILSVMPIVIEFIRARSAAAKSAAQ